MTYMYAVRACMCVRVCVSACACESARPCARVSGENTSVAVECGGAQCRLVKFDMCVSHMQKRVRLFSSEILPKHSPPLPPCAQEHHILRTGSDP
jgi:hypothetical protein